MDARKVIRGFYDHFMKMDLDGLLSFFAPHAQVESPALGKMEVKSFYQELFSKTKRFTGELKDIFVNPDNPRRAAAFGKYSWETKHGGTLTFESVVIFEMNQQDKIQMVHIIYDAQQARDALRKTG
jgi:hypothetical protein